MCNVPAILSYDPFPNYEPTRTHTNTRQKREISEDHEQNEIDDQNLMNTADQLELNKLRQQVDEVLKKVRILILNFLHRNS